jgi:dTMP kinase
VTLPGLFLVFEGGDGVGKTTQLALLSDWLEARGEHVVRTFEPGDSEVGQQIRRLLLDPATGDLTPRAEALLYAADKAQHVETLLRPALAAGAVVVCDRYVDSTIAYQGAGRVLSPDEVERIARWATEDLRPDLTVVLDSAPERAVGVITEKDRLEAAGDVFHARVRQHFLDLARRDPDRYLVLDGRRSRADIAADIQRRVSQLLENRTVSAARDMLGP